MNLPNLLTLSRIAILFVIVGLLYSPLPGAATAAFVLFIIASVTDWLDGFIARRYNMISDFGKLMDALADKILISGMFVVLLAMDIMRPWTVFLVLLILSREFLITGLRLVAASKGVVLAAEKAGKIKTVMQIVCVSLYLFEEALLKDFTKWTPQWLIETASWGAVIVFVLCAVLTVTSGATYMTRYWHLFQNDNSSNDGK